MCFILHRECHHGQTDQVPGGGECQPGHDVYISTFSGIFCSIHGYISEKLPLLSINIMGMSSKTLKVIDSIDLLSSKLSFQEKHNRGLYSTDDHVF